MLFIQLPAMPHSKDGNKYCNDYQRTQQYDDEGRLHFDDHCSPLIPTRQKIDKDTEANGYTQGQAILEVFNKTPLPITVCLPISNKLFFFTV